MLNSQEGPSEHAEITVKFTSTLSLLTTVPPQRPRIVSRATGEAFGEWTAPVREGATAALVCETAGGDPLPRISWWRGKTVIDDVVEEVGGGNALSMIYKGQAKV